MENGVDSRVCAGRNHVCRGAANRNEGRGEGREGAKAKACRRLEALASAMGRMKHVGMVRGLCSASESSAHGREAGLEAGRPKRKISIGDVEAELDEIRSPELVP